MCGRNYAQPICVRLCPLCSKQDISVQYGTVCIKREITDTTKRQSCPNEGKPSWWLDNVCPTVGEQDACQLIQSEPQYKEYEKVEEMFTSFLLKHEEIALKDRHLFHISHMEGDIWK